MCSLVITREILPTGACITEYGWVDKRANTSDTPGDVYHLWNIDSRNQTVFIPISEDVIRDAPSASFIPHPDGDKQLLKNSNVSYAVVINSARRTSITKSNDPWYATENRDEPILSCWQNDQWSYGSELVNSVDELKNVTGIKIKRVLLEVLEAAFGNGPMIVKLGSASGVSALRSQTTSPNGVIDAQQCTMYKDMERLILASFVASRSIFTDATMFGIGDDTYPSIIRDTNGNPKSGGSSLSSFSWGVLIIVNALTSWLLRFFHRNQEEAAVDTGAGNNEVEVDRWTRFRVLGAVHLFRCLYEGEGDQVKPRDWSCEKTVPENTAEGDFKMHLLRGCKKDKCMGHLSKKMAEQSDGGRRDSNPKEKSLVTNTGVSDDEAAGEYQGMLSSSPKRVNL
ncbi:hypothetical protein NCS52_01183100 [Fusarium sp. LHS14.1]|nr:hypothetical protein NCS52_01183100 [Fusarium sp. LHS14.1]